MKNLIIFSILNFSFLIFNCSESPTKPPPTVVETRDTITVSIEQVTHRSISVGVNHRVTLKRSSYVVNRISGLDTFAFVPFALLQSDTVIIDDNGGAGLTAAIVLSTAGPLVGKAITGLANLSGTADVKMVLTGNAASVASSTGRARVVVRFKAV